MENINKFIKRSCVKLPLYNPGEYINSLVGLTQYSEILYNTNFHASIDYDFDTKKYVYYTINRNGYAIIYCNNNAVTSVKEVRSLVHQYYSLLKKLRKICTKYVIYFPGIWKYKRLIYFPFYKPGAKVAVYNTEGKFRFETTIGDKCVYLRTHKGNVIVNDVYKTYNPPRIPFTELIIYTQYDSELSATYAFHHDPRVKIYNNIVQAQTSYWSPKLVSIVEVKKNCPSLAHLNDSYKMSIRLTVDKNHRPKFISNPLPSKYWPDP